MHVTIRGSGSGSSLLAILLCLLAERAAFASRCYPDYCQNLTDLVPQPGFQCSLTRVQRGEGCAGLKFEDRPSKQDDTAIFTLRAYVAKSEDLQERATAFNLSVSDIGFHRLITRYQNIVDEDANACRHVALYGNSSHPAPRHLYVSCPFADAAYEGSPYRLEYLAIGKNYAYSRKYLFYVPQHERIEDGIEIEAYTPFVYVDVTDSSNLALYVQPLPPRYNVTEYKVWLIRNGTGSAIATIVTANGDGGRTIRHNFTAPDGVYYVRVAALHPRCGEYGCANTTSPYIDIRQISDRLLIMIISTIWIPPVLLYTLYHALKFYRKRVLKRMSRRPNCLLVYSPTHEAHVNVMAELTKYLRCCNINAMIDVFNIQEVLTQDPGLWCNEAFRTADVVLVATSPPSSKSPSIIVYRNVDKHLLRLLKENYPQRDKRYYAVQLPYCKPDSMPEEARPFKKFRMPEDLKKLVKTIHGIGYLRFRSYPDRELLDSIKSATRKLEEAEAGSKRSTEETDDLLSSIVVREATTNREVDRPVEIRRPDTPDGGVVVPQSFTTNIDELNLLGESGETESFVPNFAARNDCEFRIDKLNL